jgi:hypothetical protein
MNGKKFSEKKNKKGMNNSIMGLFLSRQERDEDYIPELRAQWDGMDLRERLLFIIGSSIGLSLFIGALVLVYMILSTMEN